MDNRGEILRFKEKKYDWAVKCVMYGRKKDTGFIPMEDAMDVVNDTMVYWIENPEKYNPDWTYNKLLQKRKDFFRDRSRRKVAEEKFKYSYGYDLVGQGVRDPADVAETNDLAAAIMMEIEQVKPKRSREMLMKHLVDGETLISLSSPKHLSRDESIVSRFKQKMIKKYGGA